MNNTELKAIEESLGKEIDHLIKDYQDFETNSRNNSLLSTEFNQNLLRLNNVSKKIEDKINGFFKDAYNQEQFTDFGKQSHSLSITPKEVDGLSSQLEAFTAIREILKQSQLSDVLQKIELQKKLQESNNLKKALDESAIIAITDQNGAFVYVNKLFEEISEYQKDELIGKSHGILNSNYHTGDFFKYLWKVISNGYVWKGDIQNKTKNGRMYWVKTTIVPLLGKDDKPEQYFGISTDITKQKELEIKLSVALEEIKKTDELKNEFASMITHELKTPLTPIRGYCEILKDSTFGTLNEDQREFVNTIELNAHRLERLIGDVLDVQKLDMGKMSFHKKDLNVDEFLKTIEKDILPLLVEKEIIFTIPRDVGIIISTDKFRLHELFENLIRNSIDFTPHKGRIEIGMQDVGDQIIFNVSDSGVGIPQDKQSNIFKKFFQGDTSHTRKHGGTGLGLVICKGIVEGLGGKIWFESQEGVGTSFYFSIPKGN